MTGTVAVILMPNVPALIKTCVLEVRRILLSKPVELVYTKGNLTYTRRISCLVQTDFAAFGKRVQLISGLPYDET